MRVLIIDPRCTDGSNLYHYTMGLAEGISKYAETSVISVRKCTVKSDINFKVFRMFYPISENLKRGKIRQALRGLEYIWAYMLIWVMTIPKQYDVIHIEWSIIYKMDPYIFKMLKKHCKILSLKAHNVLPHSTHDKYLMDFNKIYAVPDIILVHGEGIKTEFVDKFPNCESKIQIQRHGTFLNQKNNVNLDEISNELKEKINAYNRVYLFFGRIDQDKGVDRLVKIWGESFENAASLLILAGAVNPAYKQFVGVEAEISRYSNIVYLPGFIDDNLMSYLLDECDLIILPYVKGSMSGVAFTAAAYGCPILSTRFGAIEEYISDGYDGFLVANEDDKLKGALLEIDNEITNERLVEIGENMSSSFSEKFGWIAIGEKLVNSTYTSLMDKI